jgi:hypothetical protein
MSCRVLLRASTGEPLGNYAGTGVDVFSFDRSPRLERLAAFHRERDEGRKQRRRSQVDRAEGQTSAWYAVLLRQGRDSSTGLGHCLEALSWRYHDIRGAIHVFRTRRQSRSQIISIGEGGSAGLHNCAPRTADTPYRAKGILCARCAQCLSQVRRVGQE